MRRPKLEVFEPALVEQIIHEGFDLLSDPGVRVHNQEALKLLAEAGAQVNYENQVAYIPERLIQQSLATAPAEFILYDIDGKLAVT